MRPIARALHAAIRIVTTPGYRTELALRIGRAPELHQTTTQTALNRYPHVFAACRDYLGKRMELNILSFGCSTGEEVLTLRQYFPHARITGAEINPRCLAACRQQDVDDLITFVESTPANIAAHGPYDAIFCMAVLQRTPDTVEANEMSNLTALYPFAKFEAQVCALDALLKPTGLFVYRNAQYRLEDTSVAAAYEPHPFPSHTGTYFDRNGHRQVGLTGGPILIKRAAC